jgi:hypothetical protein
MARTPQRTISHKVSIATTPVVFQRPIVQSAETKARDGQSRHIPRKWARTLHKIAVPATLPGPAAMPEPPLAPGGAAIVTGPVALTAGTIPASAF